jgi:hypothetical protein
MVRVSLCCRLVSTGSTPVRRRLIKLTVTLPVASGRYCVHCWEGPKLIDPVFNHHTTLSVNFTATQEGDTVDVSEAYYSRGSCAQILEDQKSRKGVEPKSGW